MNYNSVQSSLEKQSSGTLHEKYVIMTLERLFIVIAKETLFFKSDLQFQRYLKCGQYTSIFQLYAMSKSRMYRTSSLLREIPT